MRDSIYTLQWVRQFEDPALLGECCPSDRVIRIRLRQSRESKLHTLVHELIHAIEFEYEFQVVKNHRPGDAVYKLEQGLTQLILVNFLGIRGE